MEPLSPQTRDLLKQLHPGLSDTDIDEYEELTASLLGLDPEKARQEIDAIDRERIRLIDTRMPRYAEAVRAANAAQRGQAIRNKIPPKVVLR